MDVNEYKKQLKDSIKGTKNTVAKKVKNKSFQARDNMRDLWSLNLLKSLFQIEDDNIITKTKK